MKTVIQRATTASVEVAEKIVGEIGIGFVILVGFGKNDNEETIRNMTEKILKMRIMEDQEGKMNRSIQEIQGALLIIPQFTLYADTKKRRPSFSNALEPKQAEILFNQFIAELKKSGLKIETGIFGADMKVSLINDGPVTIVLET